MIQLLSILVVIFERGAGIFDNMPGHLRFAIHRTEKAKIAIQKGAVFFSSFLGCVSMSCKALVRLGVNKLAVVVAT